MFSLDFGILFNDFYGDAAITVPVGDISDLAKALIDVTEQSLYEGISRAVPGGRLFDISYAIQSFAETKGFSVVRDFVGHGIGRSLHEDPQVPNFGVAGKGVLLKSGMVLAIEPMINQGKKEVLQDSDGWTIRTKDRKLSAHFEHAIAVKKDKTEVLTSFEIIEESLKNNINLVKI